MAVKVACRRSGRSLLVPGAVVVVLVGSLVGCRNARIRPGLTLPMAEPARDPDPTRSPGNRFALPEGAEGQGGRTTDPCRPRRLEVILAVLLGIVAGAVADENMRPGQGEPPRPRVRPILEVTGTFDENELVEGRRDAPRADRCRPQDRGLRRRDRRELDWLPYRDHSDPDG